MLACGTSLESIGEPRSRALPPVVAIDGPAGSGKSTVATAVAGRLGWHRLDSGLLYRIVAYCALREGMGAEQLQGLSTMVRDRLSMCLESESPAVSSHRFRHEVEIQLPGSGESASVRWNGRDISSAVRVEEVSRLASHVAMCKTVRDTLRPVQRACRREPGLVAEGRDMGTVVFPDATIKIFLTASVRERARRRLQQATAEGAFPTLKSLERSIEDRDKRDVERQLAPLEPAGDSKRMDTSNMTFDEVVRRVVDCVASIP